MVFRRAGDFFKEFRRFFLGVQEIFKGVQEFRSSDECAACMGAPFSHAVGAGSARPDDVLHNSSLGRQIVGLPLQRTNTPHGLTRRMAPDLRQKSVK